MWKCHIKRILCIWLTEHEHLPQELNRSLKAKSARALSEIGGSGPSVAVAMPHSWPWFVSASIVYKTHKIIIDRSKKMNTVSLQQSYMFICVSPVQQLSDKPRKEVSDSVPHESSLSSRDSKHT